MVLIGATPVPERVSRNRVADRGKNLPAHFYSLQLFRHINNIPFFHDQVKCRTRSNEYLFKTDSYTYVFYKIDQCIAARYWFDSVRQCS